ncbi:MAG: hypothetical protein ACOYKD_05075 [Anaerolineaceae bacterium]|jgi:hypothetical protein
MPDLDHLPAGLERELQILNLKISRDASSVDEQRQLIVRKALIAFLEPKLAQLNPSKVSKPILKSLIFVVVLALVFLSGSHMIVQAAHEAHPNHILFPLKRLDEKGLLLLETNYEKEVSLQLQFSINRSQELIQLLEAGMEPNRQDIKNLESQLNTEMNSISLLELNARQTSCKRLIDTADEQIFALQKALVNYAQTDEIEEAIRVWECYRVRCSTGYDQYPPGPVSIKSTLTPTPTELPNVGGITTEPKTKAPKKNKPETPGGGSKKLENTPHPNPGMRNLEIEPTAKPERPKIKETQPAHAPGHIPPGKGSGGKP